MNAMLVQIDTAAAVFEHLADCPPLQRAQPPVAGSIRWIRCLFGRCKRTMTRVAALNETVLTSDLGKAVKLQSEILLAGAASDLLFMAVGCINVGYRLIRSGISRL